jgi:2-dehydropantoate 2-reductase
VYGAGAIGSVYGARLSTEHDVTLVTRDAHARAINESGLRVTGLGDDADATYRVRAVPALTSLGPDTLVLLTTKVSGNAEAARVLAPLVRPDTIILCVQNGLYSEDVVKAAVGGRCRVLRAITHFGAIFRTPGVVELKVRSYTSIEDSPVSAAIAEAFTRCGLDGRVTDRIKDEMWRKLVVNCVINPINAITRTEVGAIADERLNPLKRLIVEECARVARRDGVELDGDLVTAINDGYRASTNLSSMQQDLLKGRRTEIEFLNGAVARLGATYGIECPVNQALTGIITAMEKAVGTEN